MFISWQATCVNPGVSEKKSENFFKKLINSPLCTSFKSLSSTSLSKEILVLINGMIFDSLLIVISCDENISTSFSFKISTPIMH